MRISLRDDVGFDLLDGDKEGDDVSLSDRWA